MLGGAEAAGEKENHSMTAATFLIANEIVLRRAVEAVGKLQVLEPGQRWQVVIQPEKTRRSIEQNRRMWAVLNEIACQVLIDGQRYKPDTWHVFYKARFLPCETTWICGQLVSVPESTAGLTVKQFAEYMTQIEAHATQELGTRFTETREFFDEWRRYK